jgi:hypothetical protein
MTKKKKDKFYDYQDQVIDNLETLRINLENCEEMGMQDIEETIYNEIVDLINETKAIDSIIGLSEIISRAKIIETQIDNWYSKEGITNTELTWPQI